MKAIDAYKFPSDEEIDKKYPLTYNSDTMRMDNDNDRRIAKEMRDLILLQSQEQKVELYNEHTSDGRAHNISELKSRVISQEQKEADKDGLEKLVSILKKAGLRKYTCINGWGYSQVERDIVQALQSNAGGKIGEEFVRKVLGRYEKDEISFGEMVELFNEQMESSAGVERPIKSAEEFLKTKPLTLNKNPYDGYKIAYSYLVSLLNEYASQFQESRDQEGVDVFYKKVFTKNGTPNMQDGEWVDTSLGDIKFFKTHIKNGIWKYNGHAIEWWLEEMKRSVVKGVDVIEKLKAMQPDFDKKDSHQHGFHDGIGCAIKAIEDYRAGNHYANQKSQLADALNQKEGVDVVTERDFEKLLYGNSGFDNSNAKRCFDLALQMVSSAVKERNDWYKIVCDNWAAQVINYKEANHNQSDKILKLEALVQKQSYEIIALQSKSVEFSESDIHNAVNMARSITLNGDKHYYHHTNREIIEHVKSLQVISGKEQPDAQPNPTQEQKSQKS